MKTKLSILGLFFVLIIETNFVLAMDQLNNLIQLNQLGFLPKGSKLAVIKDNTAKSFSVIDTKDNKVVLTKPLSKVQRWIYSNQEVRTADFSELRAAGTYIVKTDNNIVSTSFHISDSVYTDALYKSAKAYYLIRAGIEIKAKYADEHARPISHPDNNVFIHTSAASTERPENTVISSPKGWFDAGDYNKYIVNSNITVHTLLAALEDNSDALSQLNLRIPESTDKMPDLIGEILWNIDWMLTMQDPSDGGVYHKLTTKRFTPFGKMPHKQTQKRYVVAKSTPATLGFAAVMAQASRVLSPYKAHLPDGYVENLLTSAEQAWVWALANPNKKYKQPADIKTGEYAQKKRSIKDEWTWAASELFVVTADEKYLSKVTLSHSLSAPSWSDVEPLALISLASSPKTPSKWKQLAFKQLKALADSWLSLEMSSAYRLALKKSDFVWGSNAVALNKAFILLRLNKMQANAQYVSTAQSLLDYVLGRNPLGISYLTGVGHRPAINIHHRISVADDIVAPIPGLLSGGPYPGQPDKQDCANEGQSYPSNLPALSFLEHTCSYASNEIAINWNAPLVYVLSSMQSPNIIGKE